jgi:hypothetical protein
MVQLCSSSIVPIRQQINNNLLTPTNHNTENRICNGSRLAKDSATILERHTRSKRREEGELHKGNTHNFTMDCSLHFKFQARSSLYTCFPTKQHSHLSLSTHSLPRLPPTNAPPFPNGLQKPTFDPIPPHLFHFPPEPANAPHSASNKA